MGIITGGLKGWAAKKLWKEFYEEFMNSQNIDPNDGAAFERADRNARKAYNSMTSNPEGSGGKYYGGNLDTGSEGGLRGFVSEAFGTQYREKPGDQGEFRTLEKTGTLLVTAFTKPKDLLKEIGKTIKDEILLYLQQQTDLYVTVNEKIAMSGELAGAFRDELMRASPAAIKLGISFTEMTGAVGDLVAESGKFKLLSSDTIKEMALASKFTEDMKTFAAMGPNFERVGIGVKDMSLLVEKMGLKSMTLGLNARTTTSLINDNLKNLNLYGFKNGVEGLNRMAQKSIEFRMNMSEVFKMAKAVWEPDKALELVANLQVIGGAFGDLNDPIKLMYMATNNVEGLQDAIIGAAKSLVTYNDEQGRFEITGVNLRRAKAMADALGVSLEELTNTAVAGAERTQAAMELAATGLNMPEEDMEFLTNLAQMRDGRMTIEVPKPLRDELGLKGEETTIALEDMNENQKDLLLENKKAFEKMTMEDVARQQVTLVENIERDVSFLRAAARVGLGQAASELIEKALGQNQATLSEEFGKVIDYVYKQTPGGGQSELLEEVKRQFPALERIGQHQGELTTEIKSQTAKITEKQRGELQTGAEARRMKEIERTTEPPKPAATVTSSVERKIIDLNFNPTNSSLDQVARIFWSDPRWQDEYKNSFLNPTSN